jgi:hypothetical protein
MVDDENEGENLIYYHLPIWIYCTLGFLTFLAIVCSVGSWAFVYRYRKKPIVAIGQPPFMYTLCFGSILLPIALTLYLGVQLTHDDEKNRLFLFGKVENVCCHMTTWLNYLGLLVIYSALLCKIYRIMQVTQQPLRRGLTILPRHALRPFVVVLMSTVGLLITWSTINPSKKYIVGEEFDSNITSGYCENVGLADLVSASLPYLYALQALILIVQLTLTILACSIKNLNQELNDSNRIFRLVLFQFVWHLIVTVTMFFNGIENLAILKSVFSLQYLMYSFSTIGFMILPRIYYVWYEYRYGHLPEYVVMIGAGTTTVRGTNTTASAITGNGININRVDDDVNNNGNNDGVVGIAI